MIRKFVSRLFKKGGLHPDMTLGPLPEGREEPLKLLSTASAKSAAPDLHPDLDLDFELVEPRFATVEETNFDALDLAVSFEELQQEENALGESPGEPGFFAVQPDHQHVDIDWNLELAWAAASGAMEVTVDAVDGWETFDFDISDLGPDPEALAEENLPPAESVTARNRRLDGVAAELVLSLGAFRSADRQALHRRFRTVVHEFPHPASHAALLRLLAEGVSLEEIEEAAQLRCLWRDQAWLWAEKRVATGVWSVRRRASQRLAFGWPTAVRLLRTFGLVECERAMGEDWFDVWAGLDRARATTSIEEIAFFTYAGFLRQLTPDILLEIPEGVFEEPADSQQKLEWRDPRLGVIWQFERKLAPRAGEFSLEPARIRNHRAFEEAASESAFGLAELVALAPVEVIGASFRRSYQFSAPEQPFEGREKARAKISSLACHGVGRIVGLDLKSCQITLSVGHDQKRLLEMHLALISEPVRSALVETDGKPAKRSGKTKIKKKDKNQ